jgi:hypothetical protein
LPVGEGRIFRLHLVFRNQLFLERLMESLARYIGGASLFVHPPAAFLSHVPQADVPSQRASMASSYSESMTVLPVT